MLPAFILFASIFVPGVLSFKCPEPNGQWAHEKNCEKYYNCWNNEVYIQSCDWGLLFESNRRICLNDNMVDCGNRERPIKGDDYIKTEECPKPLGFFLKKGTCDTFYYCVGSVHHLQQCPPGQYFSEELEACNWADLVNCPFKDNIERPSPATLDITSPSTATLEITSPSPATATIVDNVVTDIPRPNFHKCPEPVGNFPHPTDKSKYISCNGGVGHEMKCPPGLVYEPTKQYCDWP